jgi:hypothetical protein
MVTAVLMAMAWGADPALATAGAGAEAEAVRLGQEIEKLAQRNAWAGVERMFDALVATGVPPTFEDYVAGAHAARASGEVGAMRERLQAAHGLREDRQIIDWLADVDAKFGRVTLACDPVLDAALEVESMPFQPELRRAVEFASGILAETCAFDGLLPAGEYWLAWGNYRAAFKVMPRVASVRLDLRGMDPRLARRRKQSD